jgi:predicted RNA-binding protein with PIN domain
MMGYLVDGHNLIPYIPGLNLADPDDEMRLVALLQSFSRIRRKTVEVYFDKAAPGRAGIRKFGMVKVHFVSPISNADTAIRMRLRSMKANSRNWVVVSTDRQVRADAKAAGAGSLTSQSFAKMMESQLSGDVQAGSDTNPVDGDETQYWLDQFNRNR